MKKVSGFEPGPTSDVNDQACCIYVRCEECCAANALQLGFLNWLETPLNDVDLQKLISALKTLPDMIRTAVLTLVELQV